MTRLILGIALSLTMAAAAGVASAEVRVRESVTVQGANITLGEIFEGVASGAANDVIARSPAPGQNLVLTGADLQLLAGRHGLDWRRPQRPLRLQVARAGQIVSRATIVEALEAAIDDAGNTGPIEIELRNHGQRLVVPEGSAPSIAVADLDLNRRSGRFSAVLVAPIGDPQANRIRVTGRAIKMAEIPVLRHAASSGDIVGTDDIDWLLVPAAKVGRNVITDADDLIGKAAKRTIRPGRPVRARDLGRPVVIEKGAIVTMTLTSPSMIITATGRAEEDGGKGDVVRVRNSQSRNVVQGVVAGPTDVIIQPRRRLVSAAK
jgi:flagella basal body P-ring formation protein FlgA